MSNSLNSKSSVFEDFIIYQSSNNKPKPLSYVSNNLYNEIGKSKSIYFPQVSTNCKFELIYEIYHQFEEKGLIQSEISNASIKIQKLIVKQTYSK